MRGDSRLHFLEELDSTFGLWTVSLSELRLRNLIDGDVLPNCCCFLRSTAINTLLEVSGVSSGQGKVVMFDLFIFPSGLRLLFGSDNKSQLKIVSAPE